MRLTHRLLIPLFTTFVFDPELGGEHQMFEPFHMMLKPKVELRKTVVIIIIIITITHLLSTYCNSNSSIDLDLPVRCKRKKFQHILAHGGGFMVMNPMVAFEKKNRQHKQIQQAKS